MCFREDDDEEDDKTVGSASLVQFFKKTGDVAKLQRHRFFTDRALTSLTNF
jgi:hypothetical protein